MYLISPFWFFILALFPLRVGFHGNQSRDHRLVCVCVCIQREEAWEEEEAEIQNITFG